MDFTYHYSQAQEDFRKEVISWLDANIAGGDTGGVDLDLRRGLGEKGWLAPVEPVEHGGMGCSQGEDVILAEELDRRGLGWLLDHGTSALAKALGGWGSESPLNDLRFAINGGRLTIWHTLLAPDDSPRDQLETPDQLETLDGAVGGILATEDGDDYVLNGRAWFAGPASLPDYLWALAALDSGQPLDECGTAFTISLVIPAHLDGIATINNRRLVEGGPKDVEFEQVRVPRSNLLGPKGEGSDLMRSALTDLAGPVAPPALDAGVVRLQKYAETATRQGVLLIQEPVTQQVVMDAYIDVRISRLFQMRDAWMRENGQPMTYHAAQTRMWQRRAAQRYSQTVRQVVGVYALLDGEDPRSPAGGKFELQQRESLGLNDPAAVSGSDAAIIAGHLGMEGRIHGLDKAGP